MLTLLDEVQQQGDSLGGVVQFLITGIPGGIGDPIYDKLEAKLAYALLSLPAAKGFEVGSGFNAATARGSEHNDLPEGKKNVFVYQTNRQGGDPRGDLYGTARHRTRGV